jgi:hypothetical protein
VFHGIVRYKPGETVMPNMAELIITMGANIPVRLTGD